MADPVSGTEGYAEEAAALLHQYESISFVAVHQAVLRLIPASPSRVLDIGSGTGRDAAGFAALGHQVVAVEPTGVLREQAKILHPSPRIEWLDDSLPDLAQIRARGEVFDVVMLTAVWMHLDERQRCQAMPHVASLVRTGGVMIMSLRYGPIPKGRRMFAVPVDETVLLAEASGLRLLLQRESLDGVLGRPGISWARLAFRKDDSLTRTHGG
jgi:SAM-dependent methyltransferase